MSWITVENYSPLTENGVILVEDARLSIEGQFNLVIENVQEDDAGAYTCMVQSFPPQMKEVMLIIKGTKLTVITKTLHFFLHKGLLKTVYSTDVILIIKDNK